MDELGMEHLVGRLQHYATAYNEKYAPADILVNMHKNNETFY
jgi:3-hydroxyacyl-CoA dehydrogenase/enoyl-CoA hydratase/3-hydroxybutyryl-CoA epimerase